MKTLLLTGALACVSAPLFASAQIATETSADSPSEHAGYALQTTPMTGGDGTVNQSDTNAFSLPQGNLSMTKRLDFSVGNSFFRNPWVGAPASTQARDGLGPLFNTNACQGCHLKDGRGHPPADDTPSVSLFLRLAVPHDPVKDADILRTNGFKPHPVYGAQLQTSALPGAKPEADMVLSWAKRVDVLADGTEVELREPVYTIENANYGPLGDGLLISPRVAPPMIGMGLLEAIPAETVAALADPDDANSDGISGKVNQVWDIASGQTVAGRFGWKAAEPDVHQQSMAAFAGDMGLTSSLKTTTDCTPSQHCDDWADGGEPEVTDKIADFVTSYSKSLAVPARRDMDSATVQQGARLFNETGCAACHTPTHVTGVDPQRPDLSNQTIWPYSDLLLHDMGPALADGRDEFLADGNEWRTAPLWGVGLAQQVNPLAGFLHDGRARTLEEAILWHGGEAQPASDRYRQMAEQQTRAGWHQGIGRGYQALASDSETLLQQAKAYCQRPSTEARNALKSNWKQAFGAWQRVRFVDFGPVETDNRAWQFQFWPDPKNLIARKADLLLKDGTAVSAETVGQAGVAVQGFPMLEYLLFDTRFNTGDHALPAETSCQILIQVAAHVVDNSQQLVADWGKFKPHYLATGNYTHATIRAAMTALEVVEERRLASPMGLRGNGKRSVYAADAWRSGSSLASIGASVDGLQKYFLPGLEKLLDEQGESDLAQRINKQFGEVQEHFPAMDRALKPLLEDDNVYRSLQGLYVDVSQLTTLVNGEAAASLGVIRGFNSSDGD